MTRITLSTGDKYIIEAPAADLMQKMNRDRWINLEDNGRDIRIRSAHIVAIEEDTAAIIKEAKMTVAHDDLTRCSVCGALASRTRPLNWVNGKLYCPACYLTR